MRVKYSVLPFIPAVLAMMFLKLMSLFGLDGNGLFLGMNAMNITYTVIGICIGLFILCIIINIFDRKTAPVYPVRRNVPAGVLSLISGATIIAGAAARFSASLTNSLDSEYFTMIVICAVFSLPAGIALMLISKVHFQGKSVVSGISMLFVFPSLWGCAELVTEFLMATKASIYSRDLSSMFCYIFLTLYLFSNSMIVSRIKGRNPVKSCFIYGLPAAAISLTFGVYEIFRLSKEGYEYSALLAAIQFVVLGLYAVSFIAELFGNSYTKDEFEVVEGLPADEKTVEQIKDKKKPSKEETEKVEQTEREQEYIETKDYDELVFSERPEGSDPHVKVDDDYYTNAKGLDDFIIGYGIDEEDDEPVPYFTKNEQKKEVDSLILPHAEDDEGDLDYYQTAKNPVLNAKKMIEKAKAKGNTPSAEKPRKAEDIVREAEDAKKAKEAEEARKAKEAERKAAEAKMAEQARKAVEEKKAQEAREAAESEQKLNKAREQHVDAVNSHIKNTAQQSEEKNDDYYERRLSEINSLLRDLEGK